MHSFMIYSGDALAPCVQVPAVADLVRQALAAGHCVVIGMQTTGEASADASGLSPGTALPGFLSTTKELLCRWAAHQHNAIHLLY